MADFPYRRDVDAAAEEAHRASRRHAAPSRDRFPLERARKVAEAIVEAVRPACERIEIAGSIRRRVREVKDIEIVCTPLVERDLFGDEDATKKTHVQLVVDQLIEVGRLAPRLTSAGIARRGRRYQALVAVKSGIAIDLFCVLPPAQFGVIYAIRTGPAEYSARLVTKCQERGLRCEDGRLVGKRIPIADRPGYWADVEVQTPEERDFLLACGVEYSEPWERR